MVADTPGHALDAAMTKTGRGIEAIAVTVFAPDALFNADQQRRMNALQDRRQVATRQGFDLPADQLKESESLIDAELYAAAHRVPALTAGS